MHYEHVATVTARKMARPLSGLQKEVLSLYRKILRVAIKKDRAKYSHFVPSFTSLLQGQDDNAETNRGSTKFASEEFQRQARSVPRSDFKRIEYMLRKGDKQLNLLQMTGVKDVSGSTHMV